MKSLFFSIVLLLSGCYSYGQTTQKTVVNADSSLIIRYDERYDQLLNKQKEQNMNNQSMPGYRIQIYFGSIRQKAAEVKIDFTGKFPDVPSYLTYQQPNFKVRVGDFRSRNEAQKLRSYT